MTEPWWAGYAWNDPVIIAAVAGICLTAIIRYLMKWALYRVHKSKKSK